MEQEERPPSDEEVKLLFERANDALESFVQFVHNDGHLEFVLVLAVKQKDKTELSVSSASCCVHCAMSMMDDGKRIILDSSDESHCKHLS